MRSLLLGLLFGLSVYGNPMASEDPHFDLYFHHDEVAPHIRAEDGEHALQLATMRRLDHHFRDNETVHELRARDLQNKALTTRATVYYKPDLDVICRLHEQYRAHASSIRNLCVSPRQFSVDCDIDAYYNGIVTVHGDCQSGYFCVTVLKGTLTIVDPDNLQLGQAVEPICSKSFYFKPFQITRSLSEFVTEWWTAPGKFKVIFGRMAVLGDTSGVDYKLKFEYSRVSSPNLWSVAGIKSIEASNAGADHEYELSYNYNGADDMQFRAATKDLNEVISSKNLICNVYFGVAS